MDKYIFITGSPLMTLGENIKKYRKETGLTQIALAKKLKTAQKSITRWENNQIIPSIGTLKKLSKIFNISIDNLIFTEKERHRYKIGDKEVLDSLNDLDKLSDQDRSTIVNLIDALKIKSKIG